MRVCAWCLYVVHGVKSEWLTVAQELTKVLEDLDKVKTPHAGSLSHAVVFQVAAHRTPEGQEARKILLKVFPRH